MIILPHGRINVYGVVFVRRSLEPDTPYSEAFGDFVPTFNPKLRDLVETEAETAGYRRDWSKEGGPWVPQT